METKQKTLADCRNIIVENLLEWRLDISTDNGECREYSKLSSEQAKEIADAIIFDFEHKKPINEAAELYAGQFKQSWPVSLDVVMSEIKRLTDWPEVHEEPQTITIDTAVKLVRVFQSQQPASVAFLSDEEIKTELDKLSISNDAPQIKVDGAIWLQSELRKRVIDPYEFAKKSFYEFLEWHKQKGFISIKPGDFEEYLTYKTK